ncbi:hypothetical protein ATO3_21670 [Marinibacterium profundimaris]|uniref:Uncharacterized protein n=2 Tax=Marinibacterium profundimaris TaxID=1679460 RepID=A0A225NDD5_9RHOB|nr:hypothetical protein ATO3_21670 [Marinibacterium profundimaris]
MSRVADLLRAAAEILAEDPCAPEMIIGLATLLAEAGEAETGDRLLARLLDQIPTHRRATRVRAEMAVNRADADLANTVFERYLAAHPGDIDMRLRHAAALIALDQPSAGRAALARVAPDADLPAALAARHRALLAQVGAPPSFPPTAPNAPAPDIPGLMSRARALLQAGEPAPAEPLLREVLRHRPSHRGAVQCLVQAARLRGDMPAALDLIEARLAEARDPAELRLLPGYLDLCVQADAGDRAEKVTRDLDLADAPLTDRELLRMATSAEKLQMTPLTVAVIRQLGTLPRLSAASALRLIQMASDTGGAALRDQLSEVLPGRVDPAEAADLRIGLARQAEGPYAALRLARRLTGPRRDPAAAALLAEALLEAARPALAARYLARCRRRWPEDTGLRRLAVTAALNLGRPEQARREIAAWAQDAEASRATDRLANARVALACAIGDLDAIDAELDALEPRRQIPQLRLQVAYGRCDLAAAEAQAPAAAAAMGRGRKVMRHFGTTHVGSMLGEFRLWSGSGTSAAEGARAFYFAARQVVDGQLDRIARLSPPGLAPRGAIPPQVLQYWDSAAPPEAIAETMQSWETAPGLSYQRFDKRSATEFLRERFGQDHVRAFRLANHASEAADFLRLCLLLDRGGMYADADDRRTGDAAGLLAKGGGLILFREAYGTLANNLICARPGHPVIETAAELALRSLLARENDGPWSKTGPGLITRAVALYLDGVSDAELHGDLVLLPEIEMRRYVHPHLRLPYKSSPGYWDPRYAGPARPVIEALRESFLRDQTTAPGLPASRAG